MAHVTGSTVRPYCLAILLFISCNIPLVFSRDTNSSPLMTRFFSGYEKVVRPDLGVRPVHVLTDLYVESFGNIEEANMEFRVYGYLRQQWRDERLADKLNSTIIIKGVDINRLWLPDPFCYNARETNLMLPDSDVPSKVSIDVNGKVFYTRSVVFLASCDMDLHHFPFDAQECFLKFGSYAYSTEDIVYKWKYKEVTLGSTNMAQFDFQKAELSSSTELYTGGEFSVITMTFFFKRRIGYYLIQVYFPDMFVVALSWIVFWMEKEDMGNRMALGITTILTIMFLLGSINGTLPKVSYPKAIDWYLLVSFTFAFLSLVECMIVFVIWLSDKQRHNDSKSKSLPSTTASSINRGTQVHGLHDGSSFAVRNRDLDLCHLMPPSRVTQRGIVTAEGETVLDNQTKKDMTKKAWSLGEIAGSVDKLSRAVFPLLFLLFNVVYWGFYSVA